MARAETSLEFNTFVKGLITEATPTDFPAGATVEDLNWDLFRDGSRRRRMGIDYEADFNEIDTALDPATMGTVAVQVFEWRGPNDNPDVALSIVQIGTKFFFVYLFG